MSSRSVAAFRRRATAAIIVALGAAMAPALADGTDEAAAYLEFESVPDGRCQILSEGGKLRLVHNRHPNQTLEFRLMRMFAGNHQQGRVAGELAAGSEAMKLGCTRVDGRPQDWVVERVRYKPQD